MNPLPGEMDIALRIRRHIAESDKRYAENQRLFEETRQFCAEQHRLAIEKGKLAIEEGGSDCDRWYLPICMIGIFFNILTGIVSIVMSILILPD